MAFTAVPALYSASLPIYVLLLIALAFLLGRLAVKHIHVLLTRSNGEKSRETDSSLDLAEKGSVQGDSQMSDEEMFQLEKRAFFSKAWLFVCHRSRFLKAGDYHAFDIAGISFFVVLGKDFKIRAFHNVCRHRAFTVVRKACGTSTRFSCKYHGWQYDDEGRLLKAPKFDESPGFNFEENGLFEVKLILTREGLIFVNFDAGTMKLPFGNVRSHIDFGDSAWVDELTVVCGTNWKHIASQFNSRPQPSQTGLGWLNRPHQQQRDSLLGPLSMAKHIDGQLWCTLTLFPSSPSEVTVKCDFYGIGEHKPTRVAIEKSKAGLQAEIHKWMNRVPTDGIAGPRFAYKCGGRTIDMIAILSQHQRLESLSKKRLQPAIRVTSESEIDAEASALCDLLDGNLECSTREKSSAKSKLRTDMDW